MNKETTMVEDQQRNNANRNRNRYPRHRSGGQGGRSGGRNQRPLLTSAINAGGLSLVALVYASVSVDAVFATVQPWLAGATILYCLSAIVSYVAQRVNKKLIERVSDILFLAGTLSLIAIAWQLGSFVS
jgi:hypothetical protein